MEKRICVSTPSRICLFGEHQDYLGLEVVASAINVRFYANTVPREDKVIRVLLSDEVTEIDITQPITYTNNRDYLRSSLNVLLNHGCEFSNGYNIDMDSEIPIGKGMCSSTTMVIVFIKSLLESIEHPDKDKPDIIANLGFEAEVTEFNEPGGLMDHYASAFGGFVHLVFNKDETVVNPLNTQIEGKFILFDSLQDKDTTKVLASAKTPVLKALDDLSVYGIKSIRDFVNDESKVELLDKLDDNIKVKVLANIDNYKILLEGKKMIEQGDIDPIKLGALITRHHNNLRDGLGISTPIIEEIMNTALENGALGGKINGSGGGGCCYVYVKDEDCDKIVNAVEALGYPAIVLSQDSGVRLDKIEEIEDIRREN